jgi:hypothetical protein
MSSPVGEFLQAAVAGRAPASLAEQLAVEVYLRDLDARLNSRLDVAAAVFRLAKRAAGLHDLENVLLRYDEGQAEKWSAFMAASVQRKGVNEKLKKCFEVVQEKGWLPPAAGQLPAGHPVRQALEEARQELARRLEDRGLPAGGLRRLCDDLGSRLAVPATREWLTRSIRRVLDDRS